MREGRNEARFKGEGPLGVVVFWFELQAKERVQEGKCARDGQVQRMGKGRWRRLKGGSLLWRGLLRQVNFEWQGIIGGSEISPGLISLRAGLRRQAPQSDTPKMRSCGVGLAGKKASGGAGAWLAGLVGRRGRRQLRVKAA